MIPSWRALPPTATRPGSTDLSFATNQSNTVSVDASGNIIIGGSVSGGVIGKGQVSQGNGDAFLAKYDSNGKLLAENQFGTSGADSVAATAIGSDGSLYVASTQNGHAVIAKYAGGDITTTPVWTQDLGDLAAGGSIGGLTVSGGKVYVSGSTSNAGLTAGGAASIAVPASGGIDVSAVSATISGLGKREFVLRRAGSDTTEVFTTRWAMSYLRGPMTRDQIAQLMAEQRGADAAATTAAPTDPTTSAGAGAAPGWL